MMLLLESTLKAPEWLTHDGTCLTEWSVSLQTLGRGVQRLGVRGSPRQVRVPHLSKLRCLPARPLPGPLALLYRSRTGMYVVRLPTRTFPYARTNTGIYVQMCTYV